MDPARALPGSQDLVFYDGDCGFCHHTVRFLLARDPEGRAFRFAPIAGATFGEAIPEAERAGLPDSLVLVRNDGVPLLRSDAVIHIFRKLPGAWPLVGTLLGWLPRPIRDTAYDRFAQVRRRFFAPPEGACPILPPELRARFDP